MKAIKIWTLSVRAGFHTYAKKGINYAIWKNQVSTQSGKATVTDLIQKSHSKFHIPGERPLKIKCRSSIFLLSITFVQNLNDALDSLSQKEVWTLFWFRHLWHAQIKVVHMFLYLETTSMKITHTMRYFGSVMKVLDNGLVRVKWEIDATQSLVFPYDILIEDDGKDGAVTVDTDEQPKKHWKTKKQYPSSTKSFLTVNDVKDTSKNWPGADIFICPPDENFSGEDSADNQLYNLSRRQFLGQCELQTSTTETDEWLCLLK